jgi:hypothetical protein
MAAPALATNATKAQALAYLSKQWGTYTYSNTTKTPYQGMNASELYAYLAKQNPTASPYTLAVDTSDLLLSSDLAYGIGGSVTAAGDATGDIATGTVKGLDQFLSNPLFGFLTIFTNGELWIRVAKVVIGGIVLIVGLAHMSGASNAIASTARKAPLPV